MWIIMAPSPLCLFLVFRLTMPTAGEKKKAPTPRTSCLTSEASAQLDFLPDKLRAKLLPFQKDGIVFALRRGGRYGALIRQAENCWKVCYKTTLCLTRLFVYHTFSVVKLIVTK